MGESLQLKFAIDNQCLVFAAAAMTRPPQSPPLADLLAAAKKIMQAAECSP
jgi:hypothetical protein